MKLRQLIILFFVFSRVAFAEVSDSMLFLDSVRLYEARKFNESVQVLNKLTQSNPEKSVYWFNLANSYFMLKQYNLALKNYDKVISLNTSFIAAAQLYRVKTLRTIGLHDRALLEVNLLIKQKPSPGIYKEAVREKGKLERISSLEVTALEQYQAGQFDFAEATLKSAGEDALSTDGSMLLGVIQLKQKKYNGSRTQKYWLFIDSSLGLTSNAYFDGRSSTAVSSPFLRTSFGFGYHFNQGEIISEKVSYTLNYEEPLDAPEVKALTQTLLVPLLYQTRSTDLSIVPYLQTQTWNDIPASQKTGAQLRAAFNYQNHDSGIEADFYSQQPENSAYSYLKGPGSSIRPYYGYWMDKYYLQGYWIMGTDGSRDIVYSDNSKLPMKQTYQGFGTKGFYKLNDKSVLAFGLSYIQRNFNNVALPSSKKRSDQELSGFLRKTYYIFPKLSTYGLIELTSNTSTLGRTDVRDKNYDQVILSVGLSWDAF